jgi:hypothetical protein
LKLRAIIQITHTDDKLLYGNSTIDEVDENPDAADEIGKDLGLPPEQDGWDARYKWSTRTKPWKCY